MDVIELKKIANEVRKGIVTSVHSAKAGHPGGSLSAADVFTYLYFEEMNIDPADPKKADRDRFVLSKGHTAPGLYSVLAQRGYFPVEDLKTLRHIGSYLQGHPDREFQRQSAWLYQLSSAMMTTVFIHYWVMVRSRKGRFGRLPCLPATASWTTWL